MNQVINDRHGASLELFEVVSASTDSLCSFWTCQIIDILFTNCTDFGREMPSAPKFAGWKTCFREWMKSCNALHDRKIYSRILVLHVLYICLSQWSNSPWFCRIGPALHTKSCNWDHPLSTISQKQWCMSLGSLSGREGPFETDLLVASRELHNRRPRPQVSSLHLSSQLQFAVTQCHAKNLQRHTGGQRRWSSRDSHGRGAPSHPPPSLQ